VDGSFMSSRANVLDRGHVAFEKDWLIPISS